MSIFRAQKVILAEPADTPIIKIHPASNLPPATRPSIPIEERALSSPWRFLAYGTFQNQTGIRNALRKVCRNFDPAHLRRLAYIKIQKGKLRIEIPIKLSSNLFIRRERV